MKVSQMVKDLRKEYGLTQKEFGNLAHVDTKTVSAWEKGTQEISSEALDALFEALNVEVIFKKKESVQKLEVTFEEIENYPFNFEEWRGDAFGGNFCAYFKEFPCKNGKKALVNISNVVEIAWIVYKDKKKQVFIGLDELDSEDILEEIEEYTSEIFDAMEEGEVSYTFMVNAIGAHLFEMQQLKEIALAVAYFQFQRLIK